MANTQQGFPQLSSPIADGNNNFRVTQPWQQFFISLWNRTGANQGGSTFEPGDIKAIGGASVPQGWLLCDGSAVSRTQFVALFNAIGVIWGAGDNVSTFNIPNLTGNVPVGASLTFPLGSTGGSATATLSLGNLPTHNHGIADPGHIHTINDPGHAHASVVAASVNTTGTSTGAVTAGNTSTATTGITTASATTGITTQNAGSGTAFSTISPYAAIQWIIKT